ncbi:hypothetical protein GCM10017673_36660 [Streptosporangium violaceochromogenes]|nr:hypothetical protein GCM10017673_36660 [Streptosporangium violaceochromogenes]
MIAMSPHDSRAVRAAERLRVALEHHGITADVHDGYGLALVSVWTGLVVWSNGDRFWWCGGWDPRNQRPVYASHRAGEPERAARRIALHYARLRRQHPEPRPLTGDPL